MKTSIKQIKLARDILAGKTVPSPETFKLAEALWNDGIYSYARRLFALLRKSQTAEVELADSLKEDDTVVAESDRAPKISRVRVTLALRHSSCTYQDPDLPVYTRFDAALEILEEIGDLQLCSDAAVLDLAGDIYFSKWDSDNQKSTLERAYCYYEQAYRAPSDDSLPLQKAIGYAGRQAAYLLDRLAQLELEQAIQVDRQANSTKTMLDRREQAGQIRRELIERFTPLSENPNLELKGFGLFVALAESHFGLGHYDEALVWLKRAAKITDIPDRKYEAVARRLISLYRIKSCKATFVEFEDSQAGKVLAEFLNHRINLSSLAFEGLFTGKVGLALSGSGFRACFFHLGVLAKLAELGMLRKVEVLSCSSGGSIVGTRYYLELRRLLQSKSDGEITDQDYVEVVKKVQRALLAGAQKNLQLRSKANPWVNLKVLFKKNYSRTDRLGELIESEIFRNKEPDQKDFPKYLRDLFVAPCGEPEMFKPKKENWRRAAKVPVLILNATTLNTGHNWQFTASGMGEPAGPINSEIDTNLRFRQVRFHDAPEPYQNFSIGKAVIASACEPGWLEPIGLDDLYPETTVRLIDGCITEPLAIAPLLNHGCTFLLVSDASGSANTTDSPKTDRISVSTRSDRISTAHLRKAQYEFLSARQESSMLQELVFVHLKKDLEGGNLDPIGIPDPSNEDRSRILSGPLTSYGIRRDVQELLAKVRPKLDTFSDTEACALMTSGYAITESECNRVGDGTPQLKDRPDWTFLAIEEQMKKVGGSDILRVLAVAQSRLAYIWKLSTFLQSITPVAILAFAALIIYLVKSTSGSGMDDILLYVIIFAVLAGVLLLLLLVASVPLFVMVGVLKLTRPHKSLGQIAWDLVTCVIGIGSWFQIWLVDKWYMALGDVKYQKRAEPAPASGRISGAIQSLGARLDREERESINKVFDRFETVEAVSKMLEANGYEVARFPRDPVVNPFQLNLDLYACKGNHKLLADIKSGSESVDWKDASGLKMAASLLASDDEDETTSGVEKVDAMLFLIDVPVDESLERFSKSEGVKVIEIGSDRLKRILEMKSNTAELRSEAERLKIFTNESV